MPINLKSTGKPWLINCMENCGYKNVSTGICLGLAYMSIHAMLIGELGVFINRLKLINNLYHNENYALTIEQITDIFAFFDGIQLYQNPEIHSDLFKKINFVSQKNCSTLTFNIIQPLYFQEQQITIYNIYNFSGCYMLHQLKTFFSVLEDTISDYILTTTLPISFILYNDTHAVSLGYNHRYNSWTIIDTTLLFLRNGINIISKSYSKKQLIKLLHMAFTYQEPDFHDYYNTIALFTRIFITQQVDSHTSIQQIKNYFVKTLNNNSNWQHLHRINPNKLNITNIGRSWLYIAVKNDDYLTAKLLIEAKANVNMAVNHIPLLWMAAEHGNNKIVNLLINAINPSLPKGIEPSYFTKTPYNLAEAFNQLTITPTIDLPEQLLCKPT